MVDVIRAVDQPCIEQDVESRHKAYPFKVLMHRVAKLDNPPKSRFVTCLGLNAARSPVFDQTRSDEQEDWSSLWSIDHRSEHASVPSLWAVEPHLGFHSIRAKFEELLVVTEDDAYRLDDGLPYVCCWQQRQLT